MFFIIANHSTAHNVCLKKGRSDCWLSRYCWEHCWYIDAIYQGYGKNGGWNEIYVRRLKYDLWISEYTGILTNGRLVETIYLSYKNVDTPSRALNQS